jgi:H+/Cl- antiporter ClcA
LLIYTAVGYAVRGVVTRIKLPWVIAAVGGSLIGLIAFALPLTADGGSSQLTYTAANVTTLGIGLLIAVLLGKMVAMALSQEVGFLGGTVFPILFIGGTAGALVHAIFPDISAPLAIAAMVAAVPGAIISAPVSFILIGVGGVALGTSGIAPVGIAVITAYLAISTVRFFKQQQDTM